MHTFPPKRQTEDPTAAMWGLIRAFGHAPRDAAGALMKESRPLGTLLDTLTPVYTASNESVRCGQ